MEKRLYRSGTNKIVGGVCGGLGEYFDVDPVLVRVITVVLFLAGGVWVPVLSYVVAWLLIPKRPPEVEGVAADHEYSSWTRYLPGLILIAIGAVLLIRENWFWFDWSEFWPLILIAIGLVLILRRTQRRRDEPSVQVGHQHGNAHNGGVVS